jgi:hypothetical protein
MGRIGRVPLICAATALAVIVPVAGGAGSSAAAPSHRRCPPSGAHQIAHDRLLSVYSTGGGPLEDPIEACLLARGGRMTLLAKRTGQGGPAGRGLRVEALSGSIVAYLITSFGVDSGSTDLVIADVAARRVLRDVPAGKYVDAGILGSESVSKLVLAPEGAVAWVTSSREGNTSPTTYVVHAAARSGAPTILDEGPDIGPTSLVLTGRKLSWSRGGIRKSAALP